MIAKDEPTISERIEHRRFDEVHPCVRPGCGQRARVAYRVEAPARLAGRDFVPGEFVDLCPADDLELRRAVDDAKALGFGGPFDMLAVGLTVVLDDPNPLDRFKEWTS